MQQRDDFTDRYFANQLIFFMLMGSNMLLGRIRVILRKPRSYQRLLFCNRNAIIAYPGISRLKQVVGSAKIEYRLGIRGWVLSFRLRDFNNPQTSEKLLITVVTIQKAVETWGQVDFLWRTVTNQQWIKYQIQSLSGETVSGVSQTSFETVIQTGNIKPRIETTSFPKQNRNNCLQKKRSK